MRKQSQIVLQSLNWKLNIEVIICSKFDAFSMKSFWDNKSQTLTLTRKKSLWTCQERQGGYYVQNVFSPKGFDISSWNFASISLEGHTLCGDIFKKICDGWATVEWPKCCIITIVYCRYRKSCTVGGIIPQTEFVFISQCIHRDENNQTLTFSSDSVSSQWTSWLWFLHQPQYSPRPHRGGQ